MLSELRKSWLEMLSLHFRRTVAHTDIAFSQHFSPVLFLSSILTRSIYPITYLFRTQLFELCVCFVVRISRTRAGKREEARSASSSKLMHRFTFRCYHILKDIHSRSTVLDCHLSCQVSLRIVLGSISSSLLIRYRRVFHSINARSLHHKLSQ
jgi:hypothetical protein